MNAPVAKDQLDFSLGNVSYIGPAYEEETAYERNAAPSVKTAGHSVVGLLSGFIARLAEWQRSRVIMEEMAMMSDRDLSDIGLTRADLPRVFDAAFTTSHVRGPDYVAY